MGGTGEGGARLIGQDMSSFAVLYSVITHQYTEG